MVKNDYKSLEPFENLGEKNCRVHYILYGQCHRMIIDYLNRPTFVDLLQSEERKKRILLNMSFISTINN